MSVPFSLDFRAKIAALDIHLNCIFHSNAHILSHASAIGPRLQWIPSRATVPRLKSPRLLLATEDLQSPVARIG